MIAIRLGKISGQGAKDTANVFVVKKTSKYRVSNSETSQSIPIRFREWMPIEINQYRTFGYRNPLVNVKVDGETVFEDESGIGVIEHAKFFFGNTGSDKRSADVAVSNFELSAVTPKPFQGLHWKFNVSDYDHALDIVRMPSTRTKLGFPN